MFAECKRLSDGNILVLPGEEANSGLGTARPGKEAGHWMYLFPRPVYWTMKRAPGQPFEENRPPFGTIYHVGNGLDMVRLLESEHGLAWSSHARIKGSSWTPDGFRGQDFYRSGLWLGAAWKAMPADLSLDRLGSRALDLLDDMANWGQEKYVVGEVDVFKIDHTHELYGHMNINYIKLEPDRVPRFDEGWQPVLDALRRPIFRHDRRSLDSGIPGRRQAKRVECGSRGRQASRRAISVDRDVSAPIRRDHLGRRQSCISRADRAR